MLLDRSPLAGRKWRRRRHRHHIVECPRRRLGLNWASGRQLMLPVLAQLTLADGTSLVVGLACDGSSLAAAACLEPGIR